MVLPFEPPHTPCMNKNSTEQVITLLIIDTVAHTPMRFSILLPVEVGDGQGRQTNKGDCEGPPISGRLLRGQKQRPQPKTAWPWRGYANVAWSLFLNRRKFRISFYDAKINERGCPERAEVGVVRFAVRFCRKVGYSLNTISAYWRTPC